ncbi:MAG: helix-turn-helix domain-containing protein [Sphingomonas sp.]|jgi:AcrR family transcriptional regulator|uniref:TetR/AcrR family transcriptional regulator n=1 Tax=Sphingomonas sp. TaxID=28214 RepID=UPI00356AEF58
MESTANREKLVGAARALFAERGYAAVSVDEIAARAGLTKGAVYYQFKDKRDLFRAACQAVIDEIVGRVTRGTMDHVEHSVDEIVTGSGILFDAYEGREARQLLLIDGPAVLGMSAWIAMQSRLRIELGEHALHHVADAGLIEREMVPALAHLLSGAFRQGVLQIAASDDPAATSAAVRAAYRRLALGLLARTGD